MEDLIDERKEAAPHGAALYVHLPNGQVIPVVANTMGAIPVSIAGGATINVGSSGVATYTSFPCRDSSGAVFQLRSLGTTPDSYAAFRLDSGAAYSPTSAPIPFVAADMQVAGSDVAAGNPVPVNIVGGNIGNAPACDLLYTDNTGAYFVYRDNGATPPLFTAYLVPAGTVYTPGANPRPFAVQSVSVSNLPAIQAVSGSVAVSSLPATIALPTGAASAANQATEIGYLQTIASTASGARTVTGTLAATQSGVWSVSVGNLPALGPAAIAGSLPVVTPLPATPVCGQKAIATTGTALALGSAALSNGVVVTAASSNAGTVYIGGAGVTTGTGGAGSGYPLAPGASTSFAVANLSDLFINGTAADWVAYAGS
jgi:hypothetical protein